MSQRRRWLRGALAAWIAFVALWLEAGVAEAQPAQPAPQATQATPAPPATPLVSPGQDAYDQARDAYRHRQYDDALRLLIQAIQADPTDPRYCIGAARAANYAGQLDLAVLLYDAYLARFPDVARQARRRDDRTEAIQRERSEANRRRTNPTEPPALDATQTEALTALQQRLTSGPMYATDGSGAYTLYQTLLRTGYAMPDLADLRDQLANGLLTETSQLFYPSPDSPYPMGDLPFWQSIPERYQAAEALGQPVLSQPLVQARLRAAEGQIALINGDPTTAIQRFSDAAQLDPDLLMAQMGLLLALHAYATVNGCCFQMDADPILARVGQLIALQAPQHQHILTILQGMVAADRGDTATAAQRLIEVLAPEAASFIGASAGTPAGPAAGTVPSTGAPLAPASPTAPPALTPTAPPAPGPTPPTTEPPPTSMPPSDL